jgi:glucose-1-phosphate cytidylyltransferase
MVEIGGRPILWHIMKIYSHYGIDDFIICCGFKGYQITEYFANYSLHRSDVTIDIRSKAIDVHDTRAENWRVTLVDTGAETMTGGRLKRVRQHIGDDEAFCMTYGDGVADIDIYALLAFHAAHKREATVTAVRPPGRFGALALDGDRVSGFREKPGGDGSWINGGFFVLSPKALDRITGDDTVWEQAPLETLAQDDQLVAYRHEGFWQPMDTLRDKRFLEDLWTSGRAKWKVW